MFSPFTYKTIVFIGVSAGVIAALPAFTKLLTRIYGTGPPPFEQNGSLPFSWGLVPSHTGREAKRFSPPMSSGLCSRSLPPPNTSGFDDCGL